MILVLHRRGDRGQYIAERIPGARFVPMEGEDHLLWVGDQDPLLGEIEQFLTGAKYEPDPDRVLATVLYTDIVGSTERAAKLGDRHWNQLLDRHHAAVRAELRHFEGHEVNTTGDGFLASFDSPGRAIWCALSIAAALARLGLKIRAGIHTGECQLRDGALSGIALHIGARIAALAGPDEVLVSSTVKDLVVGSGLLFDDRGLHPLKGVPGEWRVFAVKGATRWWPERLSRSQFWPARPGEAAYG